MSHGDIETAVGQRDDSPDVSGEASPPARTSTDRKLALMNPFSKFTCCLISAGLLLPFSVSIPGFASFRKEIIGASCLMIFLGTLVRMRLQRCRCEVMKAEVVPKRDIRRRLWATIMYDSLSAAEHDFHCMQIQSQDPHKAPTKRILEKASVLDPAPAKGMNEQSTCLCCLEDFEDSSVVALLPCGHIFHEDCIMAWTIAKRRASKGCPVCRQSFLVL
ncbi:Rnf103 [Symbiodinium sp. CCMP2456]|nr:Rnf103 [Symbiodinium sp. CCMP2456]